MFRIACTLLVASFFALPALAAYPEKPIRLVVPFAPGGGTDLLCRAIQDRLERAFGVGIIIDNRMGAGGTIGVTLASRAAPDGYTFLVTSASYTFAPGLYKKDLPYDAINDLRPLSQLTQQPLILGVHPSMPVKSVKELIALARQRPKDIHYGSAGIGSNLHMTTELFKYLAKINLVQVPYKGGGPVLVALITGEIQVGFMGVLSSKPFRKSGQVRALAVTTKERSPAVPELPTIAEAGVPGYEAILWLGIMAPAGTPAAIVTRLNGEITRILGRPEMKEGFARVGTDVLATDPQKFGALIQTEIAKWAKVVQETGVQAN